MKFYLEMPAYIIYFKFLNVEFLMLNTIYMCVYYIYHIYNIYTYIKYINIYITNPRGCVHLTVKELV